MYLTAILPPSNIRRIVYEYQLSLFHLNAHPAAMALPPHLPLAFYNSPPDAPEPIVQQHSFESRGCLENPPWLLLKIMPKAEIDRLLSLLPDTHTTAWYPTGIGIPLNMTGTDPGPAAENVPDIRWKSSHLVCMELNADDPGRWWEYVTYTTIWRVKLKRRID